MKNLYESLLDDEDILMKNVDEELSKQFFTKEDSPFFSIFEPKSFAAKGSVDRMKSHFKGSRFEKDTLYITAGCTIRNDLINPGYTFYDIYKSYRSEKIEEIKCSSISIKNSHSKLAINPKNLCPIITAESVTIIDAQKIEDMQFDIQKVLGRTPVARPHFTLSFNIKPPQIKNVNVNFDEAINGTIVIGTEQFMQISDIKSNARYLVYHDTFCLEDYGWPELFEKHILDTSYVPKVYDTQKRELVDRKLNTLKKVVATANNPRRYQVQKDPLIKVKDGCEIEKLFGLKNCPNIDLIRIYNNNVMIYIRKGHQGLNPITYSKDGWQISIEKNRS